jgi:hypothetical protein
MEMTRRVEREWLDELPADDPRARRSRGDLRRVNGLMANARIVAGDLVRACPRRVTSLAEIGAGDGAFALRMVARLPAPEGAARITLVDRQAIVDGPTREALARRGWEARVETADVFDWLAAAPACDAIVANLFLHHFDDATLARLLAGVAARTRCFVACEPRRSTLALTGSRLLGLIGCNDVTRHDAVASVRAGFDGDEISRLWPQGPGWRLEERARGLFSHAFVARRP